MFFFNIFSIPSALKPIDFEAFGPFGDPLIMANLQKVLLSIRQVLVDISYLEGKLINYEKFLRNESSIKIRVID